MTNEREFTIESSTASEYGIAHSTSMRSRTELCLEHSLFLEPLAVLRFRGKLFFQREDSSLQCITDHVGLGL
jgi:hypothetical protein